ncbi:MAG: M48 family metallopeptidase [Bacteroidales bacterium]|nr:M48 family metallopeptidase [Bacteroidales bacterium]
MKNLKLIISYAALAIMLASCGSVALTGRKQVLLFSDSEIMSLSAQSYDEFNATASPSTNKTATNMVTTVGKNMVSAMENYFTQIGQQSYMQGLTWKIDLVKSDEVNAFALPSGNIVIYEGMLNYANTADLIAVVIGHEMAHAIAKHSNERMSREAMVSTATNAAMAVASGSGKFTSSQLNVFNTAIGLGSQYGVTLPFSRKQEYEADRIGLIIMAIAGYDISQAPLLWEKMSTKGTSVPEFLSTHPSDTNRINNLNKCMEEAKGYIQQK